MRARAVRAFIAALGLTAAGLLTLALLPPAALMPLVSLWAARPLGPTPPPPTLLAPTGPLPTHPAGWPAWARYRGQGETRAGSGFFLRLADGRTIGAMTAHSVALDNPTRTLENIAFAIPDTTIVFSHLHGQPGRARTSGDLTVDYLLLSTNDTQAADLALEADPRGGPQPGERVTVYGGAGDEPTRAGTVLSADALAVWAVMDEAFDPGLMSGSPLVSQHTGQVVGMAVAAAPRGGRLTLGFHPIASLVRLAEAAADMPALAGYKP